MDTRRERLIITLITGMLLGIGGSAVAGSILGSALFHDVSVGSKYDSAIGNMVNTKILEGFDDGTFHPDEYVTRGQIALALDRLLLSLEKNTPEKRTKTTTKERAKRKSASASSISTTTKPTLEDGAGTFRFATTGFSIIEKAKSITVSIERVNGNTGTASVGYTVEDETTTHGTDYVDTAGTLIFGNGETAKMIVIPLKDDSASEGAERLRIQLNNPTGAAVGSPSTMTVTILDDESSNGNAAQSSSAGSSSTATINGGTTIAFGATQYSGGEQSGSVTITVIRSGQTNAQSTIEYETANGSATAGNDYTAAKGTLTFAAGETLKTFTIPIMNNTVIEGMKTVNLSLKNPTGSLLASPLSSLLTIIDDEIEPYGVGSLKFQKKTERVNETTGEVSLTILRIGGSKGTTTVDYTTKSGLALAGSDYTETSGTLTFLEGEAGKTFRVPITRDTNALEEDETFSVSLNNATGGATFLDPNTATITIAP